jgi:hypothetical protein
LLEFEFGLNVVIPSSCFGSYYNRLLIGSCWPLVLLCVTAISFTGWGMVQDARKMEHALLSRRERRRDRWDVRASMLKGLQRTLPLALVVTFILVPSTATRIFKTFKCERIKYDETNYRRYLREDMSLSCDSGEYKRTETVAFVMLAIWPAGLPPAGLNTRLARARALPWPFSPSLGLCPLTSFSNLLSRWQASR